jgi:hypothetical protein
MLAGDFTAFTSPAATGASYLRAPFVNNRIDPLIQQTGCGLHEAYEHVGSLRKIIYSNRTLTNEQRSQTGSIISRASAPGVRKIFGRQLFTPPSYDFNKNLLSVNNGADGLAKAFTVGDTILHGQHRQCIPPDSKSSCGRQNLARRQRCLCRITGYWRQDVRLRTAQSSVVDGAFMLARRGRRETPFSRPPMISA